MNCILEIRVHYKEPVFQAYFSIVRQIREKDSFILLLENIIWLKTT